MGTAIAQIIAQNGYQVKLWNYEGDSLPLEQIKKYQENKKYLPGIKLSQNIQIQQDLSAAVIGAKIVFLVIPSSYFEAILKRLPTFLSNDVICVDVSKGLVNGKITPMVIKKYLSAKISNNFVSLSGPAIAMEMAKGKFTVMNIAGNNFKTVKITRNILVNQNLKLIAIDDMIGLELGGSFKNVYAILAGVCDGLKYSENTKAVILTLELKEMSDLIVKAGGKQETAYDLCGLGDLLATALSKTSRNHRFGEYLASGLTAEHALKKVGQVVEGYTAVGELLALAHQYKVNVPLARLTGNLIKGKISAKDGMEKIFDVI